MIARSDDGVRFTTIGELTPDAFGAMMVERPALVRTASGRWRLYVSCATPGTKHWWIGVLEAATPEGLADAQIRPVFEGDRNTAVKDPVIRHDALPLWGTTPQTPPARTVGIVPSLRSVTMPPDGTPGSAAICSTSPARRTA